MKCNYLVAYRSAVTGAVTYSGCADKKTADKQAAELEKEGATDVRVMPYTPARIY